MNVVIATMSRCPPDLVRWARYHLRMGFSKIYLRLEGEKMMGTREMLLRESPRIEILEMELYPRGIDQMERQQFFVEAALERAREESMDLLLHIDDDELFYPRPDLGLQGLLRVIGEIRVDWDYLHLQNVEAVYPSSPQASSSLSCFERTSLFQDCQQAPCRSYGNGKSMVRIDQQPPARCNGVHFFHGRALEVAPGLALILHFESCDFHGWRLKFETMNAPPSIFPFYEQSRQAVREHQACRLHPSTSSSSSCDDQLWRFYARGVAPNHHDDHGLIHIELDPELFL